LSRTTAHRRAMRRNLVQSLIEHETVSTTIQKAKEVKPMVERLITLAKKGKLQHRRQAISLLSNRNIVALEDGEPVKKGTVVGKLFSELGPRYLDRSGGYTRIVRLSLRRQGDNGELVLLQLLGQDEPLKKERKTSSKTRSRRKSKAATAEAGKPVEAQAVVKEQRPPAAAESQPELHDETAAAGETGGQEEEAK
jgi:large subunit ribosomal protein L17